MPHINARPFVVKVRPLLPLTSEEVERFWSKTELAIDSDCWEWLGTYVRDKNHQETYGQFCYNSQSFMLIA